MSSTPACRFATTRKSRRVLPVGFLVSLHGHSVRSKTMHVMACFPCRHSSSLFGSNGLHENCTSPSCLQFAENEKFPNPNFALPNSPLKFSKWKTSPHEHQITRDILFLISNSPFLRECSARATALGISFESNTSALSSLRARLPSLKYPIPMWRHIRSSVFIYFQRTTLIMFVMRIRAKTIPVLG